ncbi:alpha/beta hydrolase fold domain-containing protein [Actinomadura parmotrematis]|uniref:Alpha/beta hydrolase n=1 Tax=Actinomadura parmotrematis TaxID=2864039 RepID=A0ABS7FT03_9ACTN|nr:alpha/beta hydrolase fold domain-containing protein [Actinomadura parmotrematis]MBW8482678.1 alpha/beta hydrolase [Actinomadura parmotrematis]
MATELTVEETPAGPAVQAAGPARGTVLYLQGDRYLAHDPYAALDLAGHLAVRTGARVLCARYRPTFPDALDDVRAAYEHCRPAGPVTVAGERAGAGLAAALMVGLRDSGAAQPRAAVLVSALLDLTLQATSLRLNAAADPEFDPAELRRHAARYAGGTDPHDPLLSPLHANLHGLPPLLLLTAGTDPLLDDALAFAVRAAHSGVSVDLRVHRSGPALRRRAAADIAAFVGAGAVDGHRSPPPGAGGGGRVSGVR